MTPRHSIGVGRRHRRAPSRSRPASAPPPWRSPKSWRSPRRAGGEPPIADRSPIFISGYGRDESISRAFEAGSADYIVKPFSATELTATEYEILRILSVHAGRVVTSESLLRQAWDARDPTDTERVRAFVSQLRMKLGDDAASPTWIFNERGVGYRMARPGEE